MAAAQCALVGAALSLPLGYVAVILAAAGLAAWRLRDVRSRNDVVRAAIIVGAGLALSTIAVSLLGRPLVTQGRELWAEILTDALRAGLAGFFAGALALVFLPTVERIFDVTTGMTLSEWRDPKQPLLRKLQLQAPGTFNHSHTVATLAEAAAEAVGANGLHVYVGALYHDIGKMNKPDYFVENQPRGFNRHTKLSPAMSLLVIVGHVKDGVELAREYRLPRSLLGYIETHHGTTLVEYFFDRARREAEEDEDDAPPQEIEYRYPGPKPRTKEQAILMICDAVESATRTMPDPTPARIQSLVHHLATKRLMDGQFDECSLTLAELNSIEEAVTRTLASIYHGRIAYPTADAGDTRGALSDTREERVG
jgi:putative nucleotidyltransferase with HDIG domain